MSELDSQVNSEIKLKRTMGFWGLVFFGVVFMNPTAVLSFFGQAQIISMGHTTMVFMIGATAVILTALSYSKMVHAYPHAGSAYTYTSKGINPKLGFLVGWTMLLDYVLTPMFILTLMGLYLNRVFPVIPFYVWILITAGVALSINIIGLVIGKIFNVAAMAIQMGIVLSFSILAGIFIVNSGGETNFGKVILNPDTFSLAPTLTVATLAVLAFLGFDGMSTLAEESRIEAKIVGRAIITAVLVQATCLVGMAFLCSCVFPDYTTIKYPDTMAYDLFSEVGGSTFNLVVVTSQQFLNFMSMVASTTAASRLLFAMGRANVIPRPLFGHLSPRFRTPVYCSIFIMVLCLIGSVLISWEIIAEVVAFGAMFGFACVNLAVINKLFWKEKQGKPFRNLIMPLVGFIFVGFVMVNASMACKTIGSIWLICGIIYLVIRYSKSKSFKEAIDSGLEIE